jgi:hypothetical protein
MTANDKLKFAQSNSVSVIEEVAGAYNWKKDLSGSI